MKKERCIVLTDEVYKALKIRAAKDDKSISQVVQEACEDYILMLDSIEELEKNMEVEE